MYICAKIKNMSEQAPVCRTTRNSYDKLLSVYTDEQLLQLAELCLRLVERARERRCDQSLVIVFNDKGYPRHFNGSDNVNVTKPVV